MPYVNLNGKLVEVTQEQFDIYTIGQNLNAATATIQTSVPNIAAGGTVTQSDTTTATILTPNTTNTSPGQMLAYFDEMAVNSAVPLDDTPAGGIGTITATPTVTSAVPLDDTPAGGIGTITATPTVTSAVPLDDTPAGGIGALSNITDINSSAAAVDPATTLSPGETIVGATDINASAAPVTPSPATGGVAYDDDGNLLPGYQLDENNNPVFVGNTTAGNELNASADATEIQTQVKNAQQQQTIASQRKQINNGDWRVRLRLAPQSDYLYNSASPGIMQPLQVTDGIIFPYTPQIDTNYRANYESYDLTHSNYRGYFYKNSYVDAISLKAQFTAQDTNEANYLLAVITFLKSVTKMFYGQDAQRGAPPPLVYLSGFGDYQFREHPCVVSAFQYSLPDNIDYIRAGSPNNVGLNLTSIRARQDVATNSIFGTINRLAAAFLPKGGQTAPGAPPTLGLNRPTYVPTKMDINLTLLPIQSRQQVSKQFSVKEFANGNLIKGGFW